MALSGGLSFINPSRSLAVRAIRGSSAASSSEAGGIGTGGLPLQQGPGDRVEPEQVGQEAGTGPRQARR